MASLMGIRVLFLIAALYDGVLGLLLLVAPEWPFRFFDITPPNHPGYVQFPAGLLVIFALMFLRVAQAPQLGRALIPYGILLKVTYCSVVFGYWLTSDVPMMWKPLAVADLIFLALFAWAWVRLGDRGWSTG